MAENLAAEAAAFVRGRRAEVFGISRAGDGDGAVRAKSSPTDPVTVVDTDTERLLRDRLAQLRPGDPILGEEGGGPADVTATPSDRVTWVLDPIDGTVNFVYGIPAVRGVDWGTGWRHHGGGRGRRRRRSHGVFGGDGPRRTSHR